MIKIKRGSTEVKDGKRAEGSWKGVILEDGQPGYDKTTNTLKIGNGSDSWSKLKSLGLNLKQVLDSEKNAKKRLEQDPEDTTVFTYGTDNPDDLLVGDVYLHQYAGKPEADFVIETGKSSIWTFRKWNHGISECWGTYTLEATVDQEWGNSNIFYNGSVIMPAIDYPADLFISAPVELATVNPADDDDNSFIVWLGGKTRNSKSKTAKYYVFKANSANSINKNFYIQIHAIGRWKL